MSVAEVVLTASPAAPITIEPCGAPLVSFVLVTYGTGAIIVEAVTELARAAGTMPIEIIVVDNPHPTAGDRSLTELLIGTHGVRVIRPAANLGFGGGCELGALYATGVYLAFVNPDLIVSAGWLDPLLELLDVDRTVSIVAPILLNPDGSLQECGQRLFADGTTLPNLIPATTNDDEVVRVDYASAACWVMRADEHERIGGFDPSFHPAYFEDVDMALRARALGGGCVVVTASSVVHHRGTGTPDQASPAHARRELLMKKWPSIRWMQSDKP